MSKTAANICVFLQPFRLFWFLQFQKGPERRTGMRVRGADADSDPLGSPKTASGRGAVMMKKRRGPAARRWVGPTPGSHTVTPLGFCASSSGSSERTLMRLLCSDRLKISDSCFFKWTEQILWLFKTEPVFFFFKWHHYFHVIMSSFATDCWL